jgi:DNA helicase-2/ATP-dependent DNA helicase PcrA
MLEEERRLFYVGITRAQQALSLTYAEERRRNGELTRSRQSGFLDTIPKGMLDERPTVKARSTGRAVLSSVFGAAGYGRGRRAGFESPATFEDDSFPTVPAARRRAGTPVAAPSFGRSVDPEDESQVATSIAVGARVRHRKFGAGTVAEIAGAGRETKVKIDFDDEAVGRKTLVVAQANLEPED